MTGNSFYLKTTDWDTAYPIVRADIDGDSSTVISSSADLLLPPGAIVEKAFLSAETMYGANFSGTSEFTSIKLKVPGGSYTTLTTASIGYLTRNMFNDGSSGTNRNYRQIVFDITSRLPSNPVGTYTVADPLPNSNDILNQMGGWSLIVVYRNPSPTAQFRSITVADNWNFFNTAGEFLNVDIPNVTVPSSGLVKAVVGMTGTYGDPLLTDYIRIGQSGGTLYDLTDPTTGLTNDALGGSIGWASTNNVSADGGAIVSGNFTARNPNTGFSTNYSNYYATPVTSPMYDADIFDASNKIPNSFSPITVRVQQNSDGGDWLISGSYFVSVDVPSATLTKTMSPTSISSGSKTTYTFTIANTVTGSVNLTGLGFVDSMPSALKIATPNGLTTTCSGATVTAPADSSTVTVSNVSLNAGQTCTVKIDAVAKDGQFNADCSTNPAAFTNGSSNITTLDGLLKNSVTAQCLIVTPIDYSDAPATYGTPSHTIVSGIRLGATAPDSEAAAQPGTGANLDDTTGIDDEDGIILPALTQGQTATITATVTGAGGYLQGWIDWNGDGDFVDSGEQVATNIQDNLVGDTNATAGTIAFSVTVPVGATTSQTYARFRWATTQNLSSTTAANDGEVEDYALIVTAATTVPNTLLVIPGAPALTCPSIITNGDFENANNGDYWAPQRSGAVALNSWSATGGGTDSYSSIITGSTAINSKSLYFGNGGVKSVAPALSSGFTYDANLLATNTPSIITIRNSSDDVVTVSGASPGTTTQCCDYGGQPISAQQTFTTTVGQTYRLRFSTKGEGGSGMAGILKIEAPGGSAHVRVPAVNQPADHYTFEFTATAATSTIRFTNYGHFYQDNGGFCDPSNSGFCTVNGLAGGQQSSEAVLDDVQVAATSCATDRSDAPIATTSYGEALHFISTGMHLGASIDNDPSTIANTAANGDGADDDGIIIPTLTQGQTATITATVTGAGGYLQGWIDWNGDGDFVDSGEQVATNIQDNLVGDTNATAGTIAFSVTVPVGATTSQTYARFRWATTLGLDATSSAINGEVEDYALTIQQSLSISGKIFEDINYGGGAGRDFTTSAGISRPGVRVELYDNTGTYTNFTVTNASGNYSFTGLSAGNYTVRVVNSFITSSRTGGCIASTDGVTMTACTQMAVQTYRTNGLTANVGTPDPNRVGGETPNLVDTVANTTNANLASLTTASTTTQSITPITLAASITGIDFGFNFDTIVSTRDSGQGSLRQFIINSNALTNTNLTQVGQTAGKEVSLFMIPDGLAHPGLRAGLSNQLASSGGNSGAAVINLLSNITISDTDTNLDATTQTSHIGDTNSGQVGTGGTVGVDGLTLSKVPRPEVVLNMSGVTPNSNAIIIEGNKALLKGFASYGYQTTGNLSNTLKAAIFVKDTVSNANAATITQLLGGTMADGSNPAVPTITVGYPLQTAGAANIHNNYFAYSADAIEFHNTNGTTVSFTNNELFDNGPKNNNGSNASGIYADQIETIPNTKNINIIGNLVHNSSKPNYPNAQGQGIQITYSTFITVENNSFIDNNVYGINASASNTIIRKNIIAETKNTGLGQGSGVVVYYGGGTGLRNLISQNSIYQNAKLGIDHQVDGVTANNGAVSATAPNNGIDYPIITTATLTAGSLRVRGFVGNNPAGSASFANTSIEVFIADNSPANQNGEVITGDGRSMPHGEGRTYIGSCNTDASSRFDCSFNNAGALGLTDASNITATATDSNNNTSEFGAVLLQDFSDAPISYGAPSHLIIAGIHLGATAPDSEPTQATPLDGAGDDATETDDEDGITLPTMNQGQTATISATVTGAGGYLQGWIDWNGDGDFADTGEQVVTNLQDNVGSDTNATVGTIAFSVSVPAGAVTTQTYARFRWSTTLGLDATSSAINGEVEDYPLTTNATQKISGVVFEDTNYGGGAGRSQTASSGSGINGTKVELYDNAGTLVLTTTTANDGSNDGVYNFTNLSAGSYYVRVVSESVNSTRTGSNGTELAVQTFRTDGTTAITGEVGGRNPALADSIANTGTETLNTTTFKLSNGGHVQSLQAVTLATTDVTGIDFGFNFDTIVNTNDAGQGSLRQFILNSNLLGGEASLAQAGSRKRLDNTNEALPAGYESSIFMIPNSALTSGVAKIQITSSASLLPSVVGSKTILDASTQTTNQGDTNTGFLGTGGTVGVDALTLAKIPAPEVELFPAAAGYNYGVHLNNTGVVIRGFAGYGFGNDINSNGVIVVGSSGNSVIIEQNILGTTASSFTVPSLRGQGSSIQTGASGGFVRNNLIGFSGANGLRMNGNTWTVKANEIRGNGLGSADGLWGYFGSNMTIEGNLITDNASGGYDGLYRSSFINNTVTYNGRDASSPEDYGVSVVGDGSLINRNIFTNNTGQGVLIYNNVHPTTLDNWISQNSMFANGKLGIDLVSTVGNTSGDNVSINDANDSDTGANRLLNFPQVKEAHLIGGMLTLRGCAPAGAIIELFEADVSPTAGSGVSSGANQLGKTQDYGEGERYLLTLTEGVGEDASSNPVNCATLTDTDSNNATGMNPFQWTIALPTGVVSGDRLTATATLSGSGTSEFSAVAIVEQPLDYSDAPASYGSPTHVIISGTHLGSAPPDNEGAASPTVNADGDDLSGTDDEEGITLPTEFTPREITSVSVAVAGTGGKLQAWIDWNGDGDFADTGEQIAKNLADNAGTDTDANLGVISFNVTPPATTVSGNTYARFRWSTQTNLSATAAANDGEVEDYAVTIVSGGTPLSIAGRVYHDLNVNGLDDNEAGLKDVVVVLQNVTTGTCTSMKTAADGSYQFDDLLAGDYTVTEAVGAKLPTPATCPSTPKDPNGFTSSTANVLTIALSTTAVNDANFGDVKAPVFSLDNSKVILPNSTISYPHTFQTYVDGNVLFSIAQEAADPNDLNWSASLFLDTNCDAKLGQGDTAITTALAVNAGTKLCILAKVLAPADAPAGALHVLTVSSDFQYGDASLIATSNIQTHTDRTQTSTGTNTEDPTKPISGEGKLSLEKTVWNVTRNIEGNVALPGETLRYTIHYENIGNGLLNELAIQDSVPEFTQLVPNSLLCDTTPPELTTCSPQTSGNSLEWVFTGQLKAGSKGQVSYNVIVE